MRHGVTYRGKGIAWVTAEVYDAELQDGEGSTSITERGQEDVGGEGRGVSREVTSWLTAFRVGRSPVNGSVGITPSRRGALVNLYHGVRRRSRRRMRPSGTCTKPVMSARRPTTVFAVQR